MNRLELKSKAKQQLNGNTGILFICLLIYSVITGAVGMIPQIGAVASLVISSPLAIGVVVILFKLRDGEAPRIGEMFEHFDIMGSAILLNIYMAVLTFLWSLLFVIPGIIAALSYSMAPFILAENKSITAMEAIKKSKEMMNGHKADLFVLYLSFFGWMLLVPLTFGIASIYVYPYMLATITNFYDSIKDGCENFNSEVYDA